MSLCVIDASVSLAWCFKDEQDEYAVAALKAIRTTGALSTAIWLLEVSNAFLLAERRNRLTPSETAHCWQLLHGLKVEIDAVPSLHVEDRVLPLARAHGLSAYDAAYLELAVRRRAPLATLDRRLREAAAAENLAIFSA